MGIHGLWPLLEPTSTAITLDALEGKHLAIDVSFWLYQAQQGLGSQEQAAKSPHLLLLINRVAKLLFYKIRPVFVFDGENIPRFKKQLLRDRCLKRHLKEIVFSHGQKRKLQQVAKEQLDSLESSMDGFFNPSGESSAHSSTNFATENDQAVINRPPNSEGNDYNYNTINANGASCSSSSDSDALEGSKEDGIYSSKLDAQISRLEETKEREKNARLRPWEIPADSNQFSKFQMQRLVQRNNINLRLDKLKNDKLKNTFKQHLPVNGESKLIVTDKQSRTHVLTKFEEIQFIRPAEEAVKADLTWPKFLQLQDLNNSIDKDEEKCKNKEQQREAQESSSSDDDDEDFVEVSDLEQNHFLTLQNDRKSDAESSDDIVCLESRSFVSEEPMPAGNSMSIEIEAELEENAFIDLDEEIDGHQQQEAEYFPHTRPGINVRRPAAVTEAEEGDGVYADCQKLLDFLGLPYLQAPAEAEAQCVELERLNLVDGIVSDDSDVWLFGGSQVYKNMFSRRRDVQKYTAEEIRRQLGLGRAEFLQIGMLAGGDYTRGLEQVGMVAALELVSEFADKSANKVDELEKAFVSLQRVSAWILSKRSTNSKAAFVESGRRTKLRKTIEANNSDEKIERFPVADVFEAYAKPLVYSSSQKFRWKRVNFNGLERMIEEKLGMSKERIDRITHGAFHRWDEFISQQTQSYQARITDFARPVGAFGGILGPLAAATAAPTGDRTQKALEKLRGVNSNQQNGGSERDRKAEKSRPPPPSPAANAKGRRKSRAKKKATVTGKKAKSARVEFTLSEESSDSDEHQ